MKISCDIIRDILPLYAENMTSQASNEMVEEHLPDCPGCREYLSTLRKPAQLEREVPVQNLNHIKKSILRRRVLTVLTAVFLVLSMVVGVTTFLDAEVFIPASQAVRSVEEMEDGSVRVYFTDLVRGYCGTKSDETEISDANWGILTTSRVRSLLKSRDKKTDEGITDIQFEGSYGGLSMDFLDNIWYINYQNGTGEKLLWDGGAVKPTADYNFSNGMNYGLAWLCGLAALLGAVFAFISWMTRGRRAGKWVRYFSLFFGCFALAVLCSSGGQFVSHHGELERKLEQSLFMLACLVLTGHFAFRLWDMSHPAPQRESGQKCKVSMPSKRKVFAVLTAILLSLSLGTGVYSFLNVATVYLTAEEAVLAVKEQENGDILIDYSDLVCRTEGYAQGDESGDLYSGFVKDVLAYRLSKDKSGFNVLESYTIYPKAENPDLGDRGHWYLNPKDGTADMFLFGRETNRPEAPFVQREYTLAYYCIGTGAMCVLFLLLAHFHPIAGEYLKYGVLIFGSLCLAALFVSGGEFYKFDKFIAWNSIRNSLVTAAPLFMTGLSAYKYHNLRK